MTRVICVRNELQCLNFDVSLMLANNRPSREIVDFLAKRMRNLTNPPSYLILDWDTHVQHIGGKHLDSESLEELKIQSMIRYDDLDELGKQILFGAKEQ